MNGLVDDLLTYATADRRSVDRRPVSLSALLADLVVDVDGDVVVRGRCRTCWQIPGCCGICSGMRSSTRAGRMATDQAGVRAAGHPPSECRNG
jgi:hypothetical protein